MEKPKQKSYSEKYLEKKLREGVEKLGGRAYKWTSPMNTSVPDRIVVLPGVPIETVELKTTGKKQTRLQEYEMERLRGLGVECFVVDDMIGIEYYLLLAKLKIEYAKVRTT